MSNREQQKQYFFVIQELTSREIKRKYARSKLGILWSVLNPLLTMLIMALIFSTMFARDIENYPMYYLTGSIFWTLFSTATNTAMNSLVDNRTLLMKVKMPKQIFVLSRIYTALVNFGYTCIAYLLIIIILRVHLSWTVIFFPVVVLLTLLFATGISYALSIAYVFFADIKYLYGVVLTLWMYLSAIFYPINRLPEFMQKVIEMNPVYVGIAIARDCVMYETVSEPMMWIKLFAWGIGAFIVGYFIFRKNENLVMQKI